MTDDIAIRRRALLGRDCSMGRRCLSTFLLLTAIAWTGLITVDTEAHGAEPAGKVTRLAGAAEVSSKGATTALKVGDAVAIGNVLSTAMDSRLELTMVDGATITLGPAAVLEIEDYLFDSGKGNGILRLAKGALQAVSGQLVQLTDKPFKVTGPIATIGIRGTTFFVGDIDDTFGVFLIEGSSVSVSNAAGSVDLLRPGFGTTVPPGQAPEAPRQWAPDKIQRSLDLTEF